MLILLTQSGITSRLLNNNILISTDSKLRVLIDLNIETSPWLGDPHLNLADYFRNHPELGVTVVRATEQAPYNPRVVY